MASTTAIELEHSSGFTSNQTILQSLPESERQSEDDHEITCTEFSLPQADGGKDAWMFLAACFMLETLVWGENFLLSNQQ